MAFSNRSYTLQLPRSSVINGTHTGTLIQLATPATIPAVVTRIEIGTESFAASTLQSIELVRKTGAATVTLQNPVKNVQNDPASLCVGGTALSGILATAEGTDGAILIPVQFNEANGTYLWVPRPGQEKWLKISDFIAVKLPVVPAGTTIWSGYLEFEEVS